MYLLNLFKLNGFSTKASLPGPFILLGEYDSLKAERVTQLSRILPHSDSSEIFEPNGFTKHIVALFELDEPNGFDDLLGEIERGGDQKNFYIICSFKLGFSLFKHKDLMKDKEMETSEKKNSEKKNGEAETSEKKNGGDGTGGQGMAFFLRIARKIDSFLRKKREAHGEELRYQALGNLGSFDFTVVAKHGVIASLLAISKELRQLPYDEKGIPIFSYATSTIAFHENFQWDQMKHPDEMCDAVINFSTYASLVSSGQRKRLEDAGARAVSGRYEYTMPVHKPQKDLIRMFLNGKPPSLFYIGGEDYRNIFRATNTVFCLREDGGAEAQGQALVTVMTERREKTGRMIGRLRMLYKEIFLDVPSSLRHGLDNCVMVCVRLLENDLTYITGLKTAAIIETAMEVIKSASSDGAYGYARESFYNAASRCLQDILMILPSIRQMDAQVPYGEENIGSIGPLAKLYFSTEQTLVRMFEDLDISLRGRASAVELFLTIGTASDFSSIHYFWDYHVRSSRKRKLLSFNVPHAMQLSLPNVLPFLFHEAGHYIILENDKKNRNNCLYGMFKNYFFQQLAKYLPFEEAEFDLTEFQRHFEAFFTQFMHREHIMPERMNFEKCEELWFRGLSEYLSEFLKNAKPDLVAALLHKGYTRVIRETVIEAYSDYVMIHYGRYTFSDYLHIVYEYFSVRQLAPYDDVAFHMRLSAVISYFCYRESSQPESGRLERNAFEDWLDGNLKALPRYLYEYICPFISEVKKFLRFTEPIAKYLIHLKPRKQFTLKGCEPRDFLHPQNMGVKGRIQTEIQIYVNAWFDFVSKMEGREW